MPSTSKKNATTGAKKKDVHRSASGRSVAKGTVSRSSRSNVSPRKATLRSPPANPRKATRGSPRAHPTSKPKRASPAAHPRKQKVTSSPAAIRTASSPLRKAPFGTAISFSPRSDAFIPTCLPDEVIGGNIPDEIMAAHKQSVIFGNTIDFTVASDKTRLNWLKFYSKSTVRLLDLCSSLHGRVAQYRTDSVAKIVDTEKVKFYNESLPSIKNAMFGMFIRLIFASSKEVTSSRGKVALIKVGLTEKCGLANLVFKEVFYKQTIDDEQKIHKFDNAEDRHSFWFESHGLDDKHHGGFGYYALKHFNKIRNTYTSQLREVTRK